MRHEEAVELIRGAVPVAGGVWADLGAGTGTFTRALAELLGGDARVWAVDRNREAVRALHRLELPGGATLRVRRGDFTRGPAALGLPPLDGVLLANALHFVEAQESAVETLAGDLRPGGRFVVVEYERVGANRWIPHPVPFRRFRSLAAAAGLSEPREVGHRRSAYGRRMYAAVACSLAEPRPREG